MFYLVKGRVFRDAPFFMRGAPVNTIKVQRKGPMTYGGR